MTALLEIKQNIKRFYGQYEVYILPVLKFVLAFAYFLWINSNMGYMKQLDNIFVVLIPEQVAVMGIITGSVSVD